MISISNLIDFRGKLPTAKPGEGGVSRGPFGKTWERSGTVVHHDGEVPVSWTQVQNDPVTFYSGRAYYHIQKNWGTTNNPVYGSGIMYHIGLGPSGEAYQLRDLDCKLWHCGQSTLNDHGLALYVPTGGGQAPNQAMIDRMVAIIDEYRWQTGDDRKQVWGHGAVSSTACPGPDLFMLVDRYTAGTDVNSDSIVVNGYLIGGGFYAYYRSLPDPTLTLGLPLSDEGQLVCEDEVTRTCQIFERAVLEHHPDAATGWTIVGRRRGAEFVSSASADGATAMVSMASATGEGPHVREAVTD